jgi:hypothetical protein
VQPECVESIPPDKSGYTKHMYSTESTNDISEDEQVLSLIDKLSGEDAVVA